MSDESKLRDAADAVKGALQTVPVYQDALQPAAREIGVGLQTIAKTIHVALAPIQALVWSYERIKDFLERALEERFKNYPPERLRTPAPNVAVPAAEALRLVGHEPSLREMYTNLIATSMDTEAAALAHPAFVEILKQMTPDEGRILGEIFRLHARGDTPFPTLGLYSQRVGVLGRVHITRNFSLVPYDAGCEAQYLGPVYLENLARLGILLLTEDLVIADDSKYVPLEHHPQVRLIVQEHDAPNTHVTFQRGMALLTNFGTQFIHACVTPRGTAPVATVP